MTVAMLVVLVGIIWFFACEVVSERLRRGHEFSPPSAF